MKVVICDISGLEFWRSGHPLSLLRPQATRIRKVPNVGPLSKDLDAFDLGRFGFEGSMLHVLVATSSGRRTAKHVKYHILQSDVPAGALVRLEHDLFVTSPELCFVQMAARLSFEQLVELGFELCGSYALHPQSPEGFIQREPLTTVASLASFVGRAQALRGINPARRALQYIADGSASPMETILTMLLCLPCSVGGYGIPLPELNRRVDINKRALAVASKSYYVCDLLWPAAMLVVEYDSMAHHSGAAHIESDSKRRNALLALGYTFVSVTWGQVRNFREWGKVANVICKQLHRRTTRKDYDIDARCRRLHALLLQFPYRL